MKKVLSIVLAIAMIATMSVVAFAETKTANTTTPAEFQVAATYVADAGTDVYSVDVEWTAGKFEYTQGGTIWEPSQHKFVDNPDGTDGAWTASGTIKVTNHSSEAITANVDWVAAVSGVEVTFDKASLPLATAENTEVADAPNGTITVTGATGEIDGATDNLGKIVVSIVGA